MSSDRNLIKPILISKGFKETEVDTFVNYIIKLDTEKTKTAPIENKNKWMFFQENKKLVEDFCRIANEGLMFDGVHVTLSSTGISYDYIAYKNKMLIAYPESIVDVQLVYKSDTFKFGKVDGKVLYSHNIGNPFGQIDADIVGGYCVIKNRRGEFITTLSIQEIEKHKKVSKTDSIWKQWFKEMCLKTLIKKGVKVHFNDVFQNIETDDNEQYDLDKLDYPKNEQSLDEIAKKLKEIDNKEELNEYFKSIIVQTQPIISLFSERKKEIMKEKQLAEW